MRKLLSMLMGCFILCMSMGNYYAAEDKGITEAQFATLLNGIHKVGAKAQIGTDTELTREKATCMIVDFLGYSSLVQGNLETRSFIDVTSSKGQIELISQLGIMNGVSQEEFQPNGYVTNAAAQAIIQKISTKLQTASQWKHACYAISSSSQKDWLQAFDAVSFGWAEVVVETDGFKVSLSGGDFEVPTGFEKTIDMTKSYGGETYLMFYLDGSKEVAQKFLNDKVSQTSLIQEIVSLSKGLTKDGVTRSFDGVTIDFEGFTDSNLKAPYVSFLKELKSELASQNKKLNVAVQPTLYYKGYDYKGIGEVADHVILMAHDYGARKLSLSEQQAGITTTPLTPIDDVYLALLEAKEAIGDTHKIALQFSFGSLQWQKENGMVLNATGYTPSYDKIAARLQAAGTKVTFDSYYQSTYATYEQEGMTNIIWYEDASSIKAKMELAKLLGIANFSYWRLGIIPNEIKNLI